jgi:peptidoglycan hydrolase-like protein with peptidoglycan-binding domain
MPAVLVGKGQVIMTRGRTLARGLLIVAGALALAGGGWGAARGGLIGAGRPRPPASASMAAVATSTVTVARGDVTARLQVSGTLGYDGSVTVVNQLPGGIITWLPAPGAIIGRGQPLYRVDRQPVPLLYGRLPAWRTFQLGMPDGPDVRQLESDLAALGFDPGGTMTVDDHFSVATQAAVRRWQGDVGGRGLSLPPAQRTGTIPLGQVAFLPGPIRVTQRTATLGTAVGPSAPLLSGTSTRRTVVVQLGTDLQAEVHAGDRVTVTMPDSTTSSSGTVAAISRVATINNSQGQSAGGAGEGGEGGGGGSQSTAATISVTVTLDHPSVAGNFDQAPVQVAITTRTHRNVLTVPITALLAHPGGGYDVEVVEAGGRHRVPVQIGLSDETSGVVEIGGPGVAAGMTVVVPAQ